MPRPGSDPQHSSHTSRRLVLGGALTGLTLPVLVACGSADDESGGEPGSGGEGGADAEGGALASTSEVPVGGGKILPDEQVVITQPSADEFKAFTAICTHRACVVASVADGSINCDCHGSSFSAADGSVQGGPAQSPLEEIAVTVEGGNITRA